MRASSASMSIEDAGILQKSARPKAGVVWGCESDSMAAWVFKPKRRELQGFEES